MKKKIAVLTYPVKHRKTYDVLSLLRANGYTDVEVYAIPLHYQKKHFPTIQHRPEMKSQVFQTKYYITLQARRQMIDGVWESTQRIVCDEIKNFPYSLLMFNLV